MAEQIDYTSYASGFSNVDIPIDLAFKVNLDLMNKGGSPRPKKINISDIKSKLLAPALSSHYQCWFNPPNLTDPNDPTKLGFRDWLKKYKDIVYEDEFISLSCSEAVLPGSSMMTNEINDDFTGVTERHAYRRQYDDRADFTFYVDKDRYYIIRFFEYWLNYISGESIVGGVETPEYSYRITYPKNYQSPALYVNKFERDFAGKYLEYRLLQAYPISISSMPVSYDSSQLLKCTVSFTYIRYVINALDFPPTLPNYSSAFSNVNFNIPFNPDFFNNPPISSTPASPASPASPNSPSPNRQQFGQALGTFNPGGGGRGSAR